MDMRSQVVDYECRSFLLCNSSSSSEAENFRSRIINQCMAVIPAVPSVLSHVLPNWPHHSNGSQNSEGFQLNGEEALYMLPASSPRNCGAPSQFPQTSEQPPPSVPQNPVTVRGNLSVDAQCNKRKKERQLESILNDASTHSKETIATWTNSERSEKSSTGFNSFTPSESSTEDTINEAKSGAQCMGSDTCRRQAVQAEQGLSTDHMDGMEAYFEQACSLEPDEQEETSVKRRQETRQDRHNRDRFVSRHEARHNHPSNSCPFQTIGNDASSCPEHQQGFPELTHQEP